VESVSVPLPYRPSLTSLESSAILQVNSAFSTLLLP
jgi:hypothetical protein